jgi:NADH-quinone oxidoreductase subunit A
MQDQYLGVVMQILLAALIAGVFSLICWLLGPKKRTPWKGSVYECGVGPVGDAHERFPVKFYLVAIVFILFDIEVVFLWSWMTVFRKSDTDFMIFSFFEFLAYMATWIIGYFYAVKVKAIDWDEGAGLAPEKLGDEIGDTASGTEVAA